MKNEVPILKSELIRRNHAKTFSKEKMLNDENYCQQILKDAIKWQIDYIFSEFNKSKISEIKYVHKIRNYYKGFTGCVYFIEDTNRKLIKIGYTKNLKKRLSELNRNYEFCGLDKNNLKVIACFLTIEDDCLYFEKMFHNLFSKYKYRLEWFNIDRDKLILLLCKFIKKNEGYINVYNKTMYFTMNYSKLKKDYNISDKYDGSEFESSLYLITNRFDYQYKYSSKILRDEQILLDVILYVYKIIDKRKIKPSVKNIIDVIKDSYNLDDCLWSHMFGLNDTNLIIRKITSNEDSFRDVIFSKDEPSTKLFNEIIELINQLEVE